MISLDWVNRKFEDLVFSDWNPRQIKDKAFKELVASIKKDPDFIRARPVIVSTRTGKLVVVAGNMRARAAREAGMIEIPVIEAHLTEAKELEWGLTDNIHRGEWDMDKLFAMPEELLREVGFDDKEIQKLIDGHTEAEEDDYDVSVGLDLPCSVVKGDIWQLGAHRLSCNDSTDSVAVQKLMDGKMADMVFTDPPYGVSYAGKNEFLNARDRGNHIQTPIENDHMDLADTSAFVYELFCRIKEILALRSTYYITAPQGGDLMMMMMMMQKAGIPLRHCLIWVKNNHVLGRTDYNYKHEPILYGWVDVHDFYGNGEYKFSTWEIDKPTKNDLHPTMKPIALMVNAIQNSTLAGQVVVDLCLGSGSTLIACEQTGRVCYGMEILPAYVQVCIDRWEKFTGKNASKISLITEYGQS